MIVNYDKDTGKLETILDKFKPKQNEQTSREVSNVVNELFSDFLNPDGSFFAQWRDNRDRVTQDQHFTEWADALCDSMDEAERQTFSTSQALTQYQESIRGASESTSTFSNFTRTASGLLKNLGGFALNAGIEMAITFALKEAFTAIDNYIHRLERAIEAGEEAKASMEESFNNYSNVKTAMTTLGKSFENTSDEVNSTSDAVELVAKRYVELSKGVDKLTNENKNLTTDEYEEYINTCSQLADLFPSLINGYDSQGNVLLNLGDNAESATIQLQELLDVQRKLSNVDALNNLGIAFEGIMAQDTQIGKNITEQENKIGKSQQRQAQISDEYLNLDNISSGEKMLKGSYKTINKVTDALNELGIVGYEVTNMPLSDGTTESILTLPSYVTEQQFEQLDAKINGELEKESNLLDVDIAKAQQQISALEMQRKDNLKQISAQASQFLQTTESFVDLEEPLQTGFLNNIENAINVDDILQNYGSTGEDFINYLYAEILQPFSELTEEQQIDISKLFDLDMDSMSLNEYEAKINSVFAELFPDDFAKQNDLMEKFGFTKAINDSKKKSQRLFREFTDDTRFTAEEIQTNIQDIQDLTGEDTEIGYDLILNDGFSGTFEEFLVAIENAKREASESLDLDATPMLDAYNAATETENKGSRYEKFAGVLKSTKEAWDKNLVGTDDFKTGASIFSPTGMDDADNFAENYARQAKYFDTESPQGIEAFLKDLEALNKGYAEFDENTSNWKVDIDDLEQAAKDMGMGFEPFMAVLDRTADYGFSNNFFSSVDEGKEHIAGLYDELAEEEMKLAELQQTAPGNQTAIDATQEKIDVLKDSIQDSIRYLEQLTSMEAKDYDAQVSGAKEAYAALQKQKEQVLASGGENSESIAAMIDEDLQNLASEYHLKID